MYKSIKYFRLDSVRFGWGREHYEMYKSIKYFRLNSVRFGWGREHLAFNIVVIKDITRVSA